MSQDVAGSSPARPARRGSSTLEQPERGKDGGSTPPPAKLYVIGRADLPPGLRAAQMFHAARTYADEHPREERRWFEKSNTIVLLEAPDAYALAELAYNACARGVTLSVFEEPDMGIAGFTAITLGSSGYKLISSLPLAFKAVLP